MPTMKSMAKFFYCTWIVFLIFSGVLTSESYKVEKGDTLFSISRTYGITVDELCAANKISKSDVLKVGQVLTIPGEEELQASGSSGTVTTEYVVVKGDTYYSIARRNDLTVDQLLQANRLKSTDTLKIGQVLKIPGKTQIAVSKQENPVPDIDIEITDPRFYTGEKGDSSLLWPVKNPEVTYISGKISGVLLTAQKQEAVCAIQAGTVVFSGLYRGFGNVVFVQSKTNHVYVYTGLGSVNVKRGDFVTKGSKLGTAGIDSFTGKSCLTFMVYENGKPMDPAKAPRG